MKRLAYFAGSDPRHMRVIGGIVRNAYRKQAWVLLRYAQVVLQGRRPTAAAVFGWE
jgi:hypothetical protein